MTGNASVPVVGSEFAKLNPPMSARAGMPLQVPVYLVEGLGRSFTEVNEAREHAGGEACKRQASVKLLQGIIDLVNFELLETIEPTAQPAAGEGSSPRVEEVFAEIQDSFAAEKAGTSMPNLNLLPADMRAAHEAQKGRDGDMIGTAADRVPFAVGDSLLFLYPRHPFCGVQSILEPQFIRVDRIVDLVEEPLDRSEFERQPLKIRDRFVICGTRIDTGAICEFSFCLMREIQTAVRTVPKALTKERSWGSWGVKKRTPGPSRLDSADLNRLIDAIHEFPGFEAFFVMALTSDLRDVELLALEWDDIDLVSSRVYVTQVVQRGELSPATLDHERELKLDPEAVRALQYHQAKQQAVGYSGNLVFPSMAWMSGATGELLSKRDFRSVWDAVRTEAKLPGLRFDDLRNNAKPASNLLSFHQWQVSEPVGV